MVVKIMEVNDTMLMKINWRIMPTKSQMCCLAVMLTTRRMAIWLVLLVMTTAIYSYVHVVVIFISITLQ